MLINNKVKILIIILIGAIIVYLFYIKSPKMLTNPVENFNEGESLNIIPHMEYSLDTMDDSIMSKMQSKNRAQQGYKKIDYMDGSREQVGSWDQYFDQNNNLIGDSQVNDNNFVPRDETIQLDAQGVQPYASFTEQGKPKCGSNQDCDIEDLYNADNYLPQEVNNEWFNSTDNQIPIKDRHLINVNKPISINTIGSSLKNASYDIRGSPPCPKYAISPFMNSSIDPDNNIRYGNNL